MSKNSNYNSGEGGNMNMKVDGCTNFSLEFERAGITVSFECSEDGLTIRTDQGIEFKVPYVTINEVKKAA